MSEDQINKLNLFLHKTMINNLIPYKPLNDVLLKNIDEDILEFAFRLKILQIRVGLI